MRRLLVYSVVGILSGLALGILAGHRAVELIEQEHDTQLRPDVIYSGEPPLPLPSLRLLTQGSATDTEALNQVSAYIAANTETLQRVLNERDPVRAGALYALYAAHTGHVYGVHEPNAGFRAWVADPVAECGSYAEYLGQMLTALGIENRKIAISGGTHQWNEARINGRWELFDATVNLWSDTSAFEMERGAVRRVRVFYTPMLDADRVGDYQPGMRESAQELRAVMRRLGAGWWPKAYLLVSG